jgi:surface antigen
MKSLALLEIQMNTFARALILPALLLLAACSSTGTSTNMVAQPQPTPYDMAVATQPVALTPTPAQTTASALATVDVTPFIDGGAIAQLNDKERTDASSAQFYALQFGRPGAPRTWSGRSGTSGNVSVGPYVRVNSLDCREFTHSVTIAGKSYARKGTACRETNGTWTVVDASAG